MSDRDAFRAERQARWMEIAGFVPHFNLCCPRSLWCILDTATGCRFGWICDRHDRAITGADRGE